jgi:hypothetical protein
MQNVTEVQTEQKNNYFNFNKLQACLCIAISAGISISIIFLVIKAVG